MWTNAKKQLPKNNKTVILRELKKNDRIGKAQFGDWTHYRDGKYTSWHMGETFIDYLDDGQYWMEIPELP